MNALIKDRLATAMFWVAAGLVLFIMGSLVGYILYHGLVSMDWQFITLSSHAIEAGDGIIPQIFNSCYLLLLTMIISVPTGLLAGIYLAEYAGCGPLAEMVRVAIQTLASLPSIAVGLFGLLLFVNTTGWGYSLVSGALALTILNLPFWVMLFEQSIRGVPRELAEGSLALGATHWQTIWHVIIPSALPALVAGTFICSGRVFAEAAVLLYTAGMSNPPLNFSDWNIYSTTSPLNPFRPGESLAVHIWRVSSEGMAPGVRRVADVSAAILVLAVLAFNFAACRLGRYTQRRVTGHRGTVPLLPFPYKPTTFLKNDKIFSRDRD
ncbi:phosphate ABC transporter permease PstA [Desulfallas thermosapovorans]|uniref:Phosphate transport system permease protein PstA n=1 Tax=Desulfallas thermosapovorans DSM 6562 TaxID=1121431 RepID=A0A5S4ZR80_9FIRM|nr:phosphate ABC transporter permease PstA [Desulfallas thermosapovorans]TYO95313.1 phosphate ABC transporter membrane protein 2, PhoT family (TC 3.A.1.7.1) [Desulfallas thermosapovorans DSM 6562]